jgi:ATP phosphoribosyltransferase regulatory subunit
MPDRWRRRLQHHFWRPAAFRDLLNSFSAPREARRTSISGLIDRLDATTALAVVKAEFTSRSLPLVGGRDATEIAQRLGEKAADRRETPIGLDKAERLNSYLAISTEATGADAALAKIKGGKRFAGAREYFARRISGMEGLGLNPQHFRFAAAFGRDLEYYTGFTFQVEADTSHGQITVAGGGRYDNLLSDMGAPVRVPAVGCAIHTDRLSAVLA